MKDLLSVSKKEKYEFFQSFDYIFCDIDGVLWHQTREIPGSREAISLLQKSKKVVFVTNNSTKSQQVYYNQLKSAGYNLSEDELIRPTCAIIDYLKKCNFDKEIHLIGMSALRSELEAAGFKVENFHYENPEESVPKYIKMGLTTNENVGAVVVDIDVNVTMMQLQKAATYLKNPKVLFLAGGMDKTLVFGDGLILIGPGVYHDILIDITGRQPICLAKPTRQFNEFIMEKFKVKDPKRVLFIGDSINTDMAFAANCGYQKLLVLSGLTSEEEVENWKEKEEFKPDYYVKKLGDINQILAGTLLD